MDAIKKKFYEAATQKLLHDLDDMGLDKLSRMRAKNFVLLFRDSFKQDSVKHAAFSTEIGNDYKLFPYDSYGFCRASSLSFMALMPKKQWQLMYINEIWVHGPHFYLRHVDSGKVFDLTFDQYEVEGLTVPYYFGRPTKPDANARHTVARFVNAIGLDFSVALKGLQGKE